MTGIIITLIAYQLLMLGIGWWASRRNADSADFYLGGRQLGGMVAALSASAKRMAVGAGDPSRGPKTSL